MVIIKKGKPGNKNSDVNVTLGRTDEKKKRNSNVSTNWWIVDLGFANYDDKTNYAGDISGRATQHWDKLETIFEERVAKALNRLGVPSAKDVDALMARIDALSASVARLSGAPAAKKAAGKKAAAKKASSAPAAGKTAKPATKRAARKSTPA